MNRRFAIGSLIGLLLFLAINLTSAHLSSDCGLPAVFGYDFCDDDIVRAGWPLRFYEEGGFDSRFIFNRGVLVLDLGIGVLLAGTIGWLFAKRVK